MTSIVRRLVHFFHGACVALIATAAIASAPFISGPSLLQAADSGAFIGGGFTPDATVQVRILDPAGTQSVSTVQVGGDGSVAFTVTPRGEGVHSVALMDLAGTTLATASFLSPR